MNIVMMGPPGAGKGTQAKILAERFDLLHLSPGDLLREAVREGTELGRKAKTFMDAGLLVPDELIVDLIGARIREEETGRARGVILDGFPRTLRQAEALDGLLEESGRSLDAVVNITLPVEEAVRRLTGRRVCRGCGANYHLLYKPPRALGVCDLCGGPLYQRTDDTEETARSRLEVYRRETEPLISYYARRGLVREVDGRGNVDAVTDRLVKALRLGP
ncbi:MAG TPA: adenylate kinase [Clostridiales bacterium]|nr:adenylate kinase [Clostridiales bacterium]